MKKKPEQAPIVVNYNFSSHNPPQTDVIKRGSDWVNYGTDNQFPKKLIDLLNASPLHNAIVVSKQNMILGNGLVTKAESNIPKEAELIEFLSAVNPLESMEDILRKIIFDYEVFGGFAINVIWNKPGTKISEIHHIDYSTIRAGLENEDGIVKEYFYSSDWKQYRKAEYAPKSIKAFNPADRNGSQLFYLSPSIGGAYRPGQKYYPLPDYIAAIDDLELDYHISNFHLNNIKNGMHPSLHISMTNGIPEREEQQVYRKQLEKHFTGSDNAGNILVTFANDAESETKVTPISNTDLDKRFTVIQNLVTTKILSAHRVTSPLLFGVSTAGKLGGSNELLVASELYQNQVIKPKQQIISNIINKIIKLNDLPEVQFESSQPVSFTFSETILNQILTVDELRQKIGKAELTDEDVKRLLSNLQITTEEETPAEQVQDEEDLTDENEPI